MSFQWFRNKLTSTEKAIYDKMYKSLLKRETNIKFFQSISASTMDKILKYIGQDMPEIFYLQGAKYNIFKNRIDVIPTYAYHENEIALLMLQCNRKAKVILDRFADASEYDKVVGINDLFAKYIVYRTGNDLDAHTIIGPLIKRYGVCEGFSKTVKYLLDMLKIPCIVVFGAAMSSTTSRTELHAWNMVKIEGSWCHIDITFNTTIMVNRQIRYDYFGLSDDEIRLDHEYDIVMYPEAVDSGLCYYKRFNLVIKNRQQFKDYFSECVKNKINNIIVKLPSTVAEVDIEKKVMEVIVADFDYVRNSHTYSINYNRKQKVVHIQVK